MPTIKTEIRINAPKGKVLESLLKYGLAGAPMDWLIVRTRFAKMVPAVLENLKSLEDGSQSARIVE